MQALRLVVHAAWPMIMVPPLREIIAQHGSLPAQFPGPSQLRLTEASVQLAWQLNDGALPERSTQHSSPSPQVCGPHIGPASSIGGATSCATSRALLSGGATSTPVASAAASAIETTSDPGATSFCVGTSLVTIASRTTVSAPATSLVTVSMVDVSLAVGVSVAPSVLLTVLPQAATTNVAIPN